MRDIRQDPRYIKYVSQIGWKVEKIDNVYCFIKKIPVIGNIVKIQRPEKFHDKTIKLLQEKYKPFRIYVEPKNENQVLSIKNLGFKQNRSPFVPSKTLQIDLTKSGNTIYKNFKKDAKYAIRKNLQFRIYNLQTNNIKQFRDSWKKAVNWKRYVTPLSDLEILKKEFGHDCIFLNSEDNGSGAIFVKSKDTAYYWQAFTNKSARKKLIQYKVVYEGILWAKKRGAKLFDFEGIYDERFPIKSWKGFTHFKKSFGGVERQYPGCFGKARFW